MQSTKAPYEVPTIRWTGEVVRHTRANKLHEIESDCTPLTVIGGVGFGV